MRLLIAWPFALVLLAAPAAAQNQPTQYSTVFGGSGGTTFSRDCGPGRVMTGVRGREGLVLDAIGLVCRPVSGDGTLGPSSAVGTLVGGGGGTADEALCPSERPVMVGLIVFFGDFVNRLVLRCASWTAATRSWAHDESYSGWVLGAQVLPSARRREFTCGSNRQPMSGLRGRATAVVDAVGAICDEP